MHPTLACIFFRPRSLNMRYRCKGGDNSTRYSKRNASLHSFTGDATMHSLHPSLLLAFPSQHGTHMGPISPQEGDKMGGRCSFVFSHPSPYHLFFLWGDGSHVGPRSKSLRGEMGGTGKCIVASPVLQHPSLLTWYSPLRHVMLVPTKKKTPKFFFFSENQRTPKPVAINFIFNHASLHCMDEALIFWLNYFA
jgi:hypothetical protein